MRDRPTRRSEGERRLDHLVRDRRQWQRQTREFLLVALASTPGGPNATAAALELGRALAATKARRTEKEVLICELDFWAPALAGHLGLPPARISRDLLSSYCALVEDRELHDELRRDQGLLRGNADLERWVERLRPLLPAPLREGEHLLAFPATSDDEAFERAKSFPPAWLVSHPTEPVALPGIAALRLLLAVAAREHRAGVLLLALPPGWNTASLLAMGSLADVVILLHSGTDAERVCLRPLADFLAVRRQGQTTRPEFEDDLVLVTHTAGGTPDEEETPALTATPGKRPFAQERLIAIDAGGRLSPEDLSSLARDLDVRAASKTAGGVELEQISDPAAADRALLEELAAQGEPEARRLRILVEKGPYGEYPLKRLGERTRGVLASLGEGGEGFALEPVPITHADLLAGLSDVESLRADLEKAGVELLTFPHYMLGALVESDMLLPWHVLEEALTEAGDTVLEEHQIERWFHQVAEMCRYNGVLYAVPYSLLQKLMLVKKGSDLLRAAPRWQSLGTRLEQAADGDEAWPLLLETQLDHVGVWYDWLEFVHAFGGADFRPPPGNEGTYRGSDYGECWINHPRTVDATVFYLDLLAHTQRRVRQPIDWDRLLDIFLADEASQLTIAWSDIVAYHWRRPDEGQRSELPEAELPIGLEERVEARPFPLGNDAGRTSVEGWVLAAPSWLAPGRRRLAARLMAWFLSAEVQRRYAEHGGNTARRDVGHALGEVQKTVHRSILFPLRRPALKTTFREAPVVIRAIGAALDELVAPLLEDGASPDAAGISGRLDQLARHVTHDLLRDQARYRPPAHWRRRQAEETR